jgi:UDP-N-acetylglucosamine/UDP-N-acetyl-alpha-D-glucosaminouronate 4-epimerase
MRAFSPLPAICGQVVNVGCDERVSLLELVRVFNMLLGTKIDPVFDAARPGDIRHSLVAIGKALRLLGYRPAVLIREGSPPRSRG